MIDLSDFEKKLVVRNLQAEDIDDLITLGLLCFPRMKPWNKKQLRSQLTIFPEGQIVIEFDGRLVASSSSLIIDLAKYAEDAGWNELTDQGLIRNHDAKGDTLYGMEMMVDPQYRNMKLARRLYDARKDLARKYNLKRILIGGRIPGYKAVREKMSAREYVEKVLNKEVFDSVLTSQLANGFVLKRIIAHYLDDDTDSRGFATLLEWVNLDHVPADVTRSFPSDPVRICVVQYQMREISSASEFSKQCEFFVDAASKYDCDFVLFPERLTSQLLTMSDEAQPADAMRELSDFTKHYLEIFSGLAVKYSVNIIGGSHFTVEDNSLFNIAYLFRRDGTIGYQHKLNITQEERHWWGVVAGNKIEVFETDRAKIAIQIGTDIQAPEITQAAVAGGAQIIFVPFSTEERNAYLRIRYCAQARAIENHVYVAVAGAVGNLPGVRHLDIHYAQSGIYTPADIQFAQNAIAAECEPNIEAVIFEDLDLMLLVKSKAARSVKHSARKTN